MRKILLSLLSFASIVMPGIAFAAEEQSLKSLIESLVRVMNSTVPLLFAIAGAVFMWGVIKTIYNGDKPAAREQGRSLMIYGIVAIAVMMGIWGLAFFVKDSFFPSAPTPFESHSGGQPIPIDNAGPGDGTANG